MNRLSLDAPRVYVVNKVAQGLKERGVDVDPLKLLPHFDERWLNRVREKTEDGLLTVKHPALVAAIEREIDSRQWVEHMRRWFS